MQLSFKYCVFLCATYIAPPTAATPTATGNATLETFASPPANNPRPFAPPASSAALPTPSTAPLTFLASLNIPKILLPFYLF